MPNVYVIRNRLDDYPPLVTVERWEITEGGNCIRSTDDVTHCANLLDARKALPMGVSRLDKEAIEPGTTETWY